MNRYKTALITVGVSILAGCITRQPVELRAFHLAYRQVTTDMHRDDVITLLGTPSMTFLDTGEEWGVALPEVQTYRSQNTNGAVGVAVVTFVGDRVFSKSIRHLKASDERMQGFQQTD